MCDMNRSDHVRRRAAATVAALVLAFLVGGGGISIGRLAAAQDTPAETPAAEATTTPGVLETPAAAIDCGTDPFAPTPAAAADAVYSIVAEESEARYRAQEELAGRGATEAVGRTNAFIGTIFLGADGLPVACSRFDADLRTLQSDEARRDNYLYDNTLETETYPLATFVLTGVEGLTGPLTEGEETTFLLIGDLTLHGVTKAVAWEATVMLDGDTIEGTARTEFDMPDFAIEPPVVGPVVGLDETVALEVDITAERAG
jgi:polyisoprenoid-binding protein YceI